jgi:uncharacterized protein (DUF302 family)/uncharacterized membrane protein YidH (DUF202 family)
MGFGFVVARFALFLEQMRIVPHTASIPSHGVSLWFGTALIGAGVVVNVFAGWRHARLLRELDRGEEVRSRPSAYAVAIAVFLALVGLAMAVYLVLLQSSTSAHATKNEEISMTPQSGKGIIDKATDHSVDETVEKLKAILQAKGVALFALVDHSGEAAKVGMKMPPTKLLIFGNPKAGTPLMLAAPSSAIDLPLKILVWEDVQGKVWVSYNSPQYLQERHGLPQELLSNIAGVEAIAAKAAE